MKILSKPVCCPRPTSIGPAQVLTGGGGGGSWLTEMLLPVELTVGWVFSAIIGGHEVEC